MTLEEWYELTAISSLQALFSIGIPVFLSTGFYEVAYVIGAGCVTASV